MKIINHRLCKDDDTPYLFKQSPNSGGKVTHEYLVIHYTAGLIITSHISIWQWFMAIMPRGIHRIEHYL